MGFIERISEDIRAVMQRDPAARHRGEVLLCYPGVHAVWMHRLGHRLWHWELKLLARWVAHLARFLTAIEIHPAATIGRRFVIDHGFGVVIGETAKIGDDVTIYHAVTLGGVTLDKTVRHPQIGNDVIIGAGAKLLGPVKVGDGARIGSNAVVVDDVAAKSTVVGIPAHPVSVWKDLRRAEQASFEAYGTPRDNFTDPMQEELMQLRRELEALREQVREKEPSSPPAKRRRETRQPKGGEQ